MERMEERQDEASEGCNESDAGKGNLGENVGEQSAENGEEDGLLGDVAADPTQRLFEGRKQNDGVGNAIRSVQIATFPAR